MVGFLAILFAISELNMAQDPAAREPILDGFQVSRFNSCSLVVLVESVGDDSCVL